MMFGSGGAQGVGPEIAGKDLISVCGDIVVINLPHRADRRAEFSDQLRRIGLSFDNPHVHLFPAVRPSEQGGWPSIGARGCFMSHLGVLRQALESGAESILLCEDDLDFADDLPGRMESLAARLKERQWDIFYGFTPTAVNINESGNGDLLVEIPPETGILCAHCVAFRRSAIEALVPYLEAILSRPPGDPAGGPMHVDGAYNWFRKAHPEIRVLAARKAIGFQRSSRTDIATLGWKDTTPGVRYLMRFARKFRNVLGRSRTSAMPR